MKVQDQYEELEEVKVVDEDGEEESGGDVLTKEWNSKVAKAKLKVRLHHLLYLLMVFGFVGFIGSCIFLRWTAKTHRLEHQYNCTITKTEAASCSEGPGEDCALVNVALFLCNETLNGTIRIDVAPSKINQTYPLGSFVPCYAIGSPQQVDTTGSECKIVPQSSRTDIVTACFFLIATIASTLSCAYCAFWRKFKRGSISTIIGNTHRTHYDEL
eukprot:TRINITY_DN1370_c0_g1_i1.p1 TRINITY_DN1370_c0_g1~~TRINITY_DN1370_c0_g1_i1.p1  ORF type:complete len:214 (+),score=31.57 TRINITY_DN1370_c0_g1_i1:142-783(+)